MIRIVNKLKKPDWLLGVLILLPFLLGALNELLGLPRAIRYIMDLAWCLLLLQMLLCNRRIDLNGSKPLAWWIAVFVGYTLLAYIVNFQSPLYYLWGLRNNFRFYVAFFAFVVFLTPKRAEDWLKILDQLFWMDIVVSLIQFFGFGLEQDFLGGLFGSEAGVNGYTNIFFLIVVAKSILLYMENREKAWVCVAKCAAALLVAAMAELKFFFVEFILVMVLVVLFNKFTKRKIWVLISGLIAAVISAALLTSLFPEFKGWFSVRWFLEEALVQDGYTYTGDLNRLTAITGINELWLTNLGQQLFGLGLGNCDTSSIGMLNTLFFQEYGNMHYTWMSYASMYLECGWVGLLFYFGFFGLLFFAANKIEKQSEGNTKSYCVLAKIMALLCVIISVYNSSLRAESGYMMYFVLALPFVFFRYSQKQNH